MKKLLLSLSTIVACSIVLLVSSIKHDAESLSLLDANVEVLTDGEIQSGEVLAIMGYKNRWLAKGCKANTNYVCVVKKSEWPNITIDI